MIDINQVQRDFDNGVMLCRETIRQVIELAGKKQAEEVVATVIKNGAERQWMSEALGSLPDGIYSLCLAAPISKDSSCG